jgi:pantoate--beta-alanine ligase
MFDSKLRGAYRPGVLTVHHDPAVLGAVSAALRGVGRTVALVPTMGALHEGHLEIVRLAKRTNQIVIVSIFVNPLQFGANEDLDKYPRTLDADVELLRAEGVELVFAPSVSDMYPDGPRTTVHPGPLGAELEGASRPTHFAGMLTVVAKLLQIARPTEAFFGEKDYQQLTLIRQLVRDLNFDVKITPVVTVREPDGLALSSRNRYLDPVQREPATVGRWPCPPLCRRANTRAVSAATRFSRPPARCSTPRPAWTSTTWSCVRPPWGPPRPPATPGC